MSIQGNVNQALGIGAALLSQTGRAQTVREQAAAKQNVKNITASLKMFEGDVPTESTASPYERLAWSESRASLLERGAQAHSQLGNAQQFKEFAIEALQAKEVAANARAQLAKMNKTTQMDSIKAFLNRE